MASPEALRARSFHVARVIFPLVAVDYAAVGMMRTLLPFLANRHLSSAALIGALESMYGLGQVCGSLILGRLSDGRGRRAVLLVSLLGSALGYAMAGAARSAPVLMLSRLPVGLAKQTVTVSRAVVADVTDGATRSTFFAWLTAVTGFGYAAGPVVGAFLARSFSEEGTVLAAAGLFVLLLPLVAVLPETSPQCKTSASWMLHSRCSALQRHDPTVLRALAIMALPEMAIIMFSSTVLGSIAVRDLGETKLWLGSVNAAMAGGAGLFAAFCLPWVTWYIGDTRTLLLGYVAYGVASAYLLLSLSSTTVMLSSVPFAVGVAVLRSTPAAYVSKRMPPEVQGEALGLLDAISSVCRVFCPLAAGLMIDAWGSPALLLLQALLCFGAAVAAWLFLADAAVVNGHKTL